MLPQIPEAVAISFDDEDMDMYSAQSESSKSPHSNFDQDQDLGRASPAPSQYTLTESLMETCFTSKHGRQVSGFSDVYIFAQDIEEEARQDFEHHLLTHALGGLYIGPVEGVLNENGHQPKHVGDLGCGSGIWAIEIAKRFPFSEVHGIDLVPIQRAIEIPPNCHFEIDDLNNKLDHYNNYFDYVHARSISGGIRDYHGLIDQIANILRPGGLVQLVETDYRLYWGKQDGCCFPVCQYPNEFGHSWYVEWLEMLKYSMRKMGANIDAAALNRKWLREHPAFEEMEYRDMWVPTGSFLPSDSMENIRENELGLMMVQDINGYVKNARPLLLDHYTMKKVDEIEAKTIAEMMSSSRPQSWIRSTVVCSRRKPHKTNPTPLPGFSDHYKG